MTKRAVYVIHKERNESGISTTESGILTLLLDRTELEIGLHRSVNVSSMSRGTARIEIIGALERR